MPDGLPWLDLGKQRKEPMSHFPLDESNPLWVKGWAVLRSSPWHLHGLYTSRVQADLVKAVLGTDYKVIYGSRRLATDDFIHAGEDDEIASMPETLTRWEKGEMFIEIEIANGENSAALVAEANVPWVELPLELKEQVSVRAEQEFLPFFTAMKSWAESHGFVRTSGA